MIHLEAYVVYRPSIIHLMLLSADSLSSCVLVNLHVKNAQSQYFVIFHFNVDKVTVVLLFRNFRCR